MKTRTSIVLATLALGLVIFIFGFERGCATTDDREERAERVLPDFDRDEVDRVVLGQGDDRVELTRVEAAEGDGGPPGAVGHWRILHPRELEADEGAVDSLLSAIDWLDRRRTVEEEGAVERPSFGLSSPRARVTLRLRGRDITLLLGADAPGESIYLAVEGDDDRVLAVDREVLESLSLEVGDLRNKRLANARVSRIDAIRLRGSFHAVRRGPMRWQLETPLRMRADTTALERILRDLERLRATRFVADDVADDGLQRYGLGSAARQVTLRIAEEEAPLVLRFGSECEGHSGELYATALGSGTVACIEAEAIESLGGDVERLRDMRATRLRASAVEGLRIERDGSEVALERDGDEWSISGDEPLAADAEAVEDLLEALREASASAVETDLEAFGLAGEAPGADVVIRLEVTDDEGAGSEVLRIVLDDDRALLRRGDEAVLLVLPREFCDGLHAEAVRFRDRQVLEERAAEATEIEIQAGGSRQLLRKPETIWRLSAPVEHLADDTVVREVVRSLADLRAARLVAASPLPEHGLARPRITLRIRFEGGGTGEDADGGAADGGGETSREHEIHVGAETDGGAFARLAVDDAPVFVMEATLVGRLAAPLIDRDLFSFDADAVESVLIERGEDRFELRLREGSWRTADGEDVEAAGVVSLLSRLSVTRAAAAIAYGPPPTEAALRPPRARVIIGLDDEEESTPETISIDIGAEHDVDGETRIFARRDGVDVTFDLPARSLQPALEHGASTIDTE